MTATQRRNRDWLNGFGSLVHANLTSDRALQERIIGVMSDLQDAELGPLVPRSEAEDAVAGEAEKRARDVAQHEQIGIAAALCALAVDALAQATDTTPKCVLDNLMTSPVVLQRLRDDGYIS